MKKTIILPIIISIPPRELISGKKLNFIIYLIKIIILFYCKYINTNHKNAYTPKINDAKPRGRPRLNIID